MNPAADIKAGSRWREMSPKWPHLNTVRVLGTVAGYVVHRYPRCTVVATHHSDFRRRFVPVNSGRDGG